jgi:CheY-like chemotaxis protein
LNTLSCLDDPARLAALRQSGLLDSPAIAALERLTRLPAQLPQTLVGEEPVQSASERVSPGEETSPAALSPGNRGLHIWLLDDEEALVSMSSRALQRLGYQVSGFTDWSAALEKFRANPHQFAVAMVDLNMPQHSGIEVAKLLRARRPDLPVIITTGYCTLETQEVIRSAGIRHVLEKPVTIDELARGIQQAIADTAFGVSP